MSGRDDYNSLKPEGKMTSLLTLVVLVLIAFLGSYFFKKYKPSNPFVNSLAYTGSLYFLLGILFGPRVLDVINQTIIKDINVLYALVLGWVGFLVGLQTNVKRMIRFPARYYLFSSANFFIVILFTFSLFYACLSFTAQTPGLVSLLVLSVAGSVTSPIMFGIVARDYKVVPEISHILQFNSAFDNLLGIFLFGIAIALSTIITKDSIAGYGLLLSLIIPLLAVAIYYFLDEELKTSEEKFLLLLGLLFIVDGVALYFSQSLIFISFVFGAGLANSPVKTRSMLQDVARLEKPMYILLLVFVGVNLNYSSVFYLLVFSFFFLIHLGSKMLSGYLTQFIVPEKYRLGNWTGLANLGLGGLPLAMILDFYLIKNKPEALVFLFAITLTLIIQDAISWFYLKKTITKSPR